MLVERRGSLYTASMRDELKRLKKAVRDKCLECSGGTPAEVELCELEECPLFPFRMELWPSLFDAGPVSPKSLGSSGEERVKGSDAAAPGQFKLF